MLGSVQESMITVARENYIWCARAKGCMRNESVNFTDCVNVGRVIKVPEEMIPLQESRVASGMRTRSPAR